MTTRSRLAVAALAAVLVTIAATVATVVGRDDGSSAVAAGGNASTVAVQLADMRIVPSVITVERGTRLVLQVTNTDAMPHDLYIDGNDRPRTPMLSPGRSATLDVGTVTGSLDGWCTVPGHKAAGMTLTIRVSGEATSGSEAVVDFGAAPGPDWKPYDARLQPVPPGTVHRAKFTIRDTLAEVAPGIRQTRWTYDGTAPGPILHGKVGDTFLVTVVNDSGMAHGIDFHAGSVNPDGPMRAIPPGDSLTYAFTAAYSGAWLYHCSTMPMSLHLANGMFGAVIVDPPDADPVAAEYVLIQSELYVGGQGGIADEAKLDAGRPDAVVFNGYVNQYDHAPLAVPAGKRIRVWVVDAGPRQPTSFHVVGAQFDTVFAEGAYLLRPGNPQRGGAQGLDLGPGQGGFVEFTLPEPGHYPFLDHDLIDAEHGAHGVLVAK